MTQASPNFPSRPTLKLVGEDGNAFVLIGLASRTARRAGWTAEDVKRLSSDLMSSGSYDELLSKLCTHFEVE